MKSNDHITSSQLSLTEYHIRVLCVHSADVRGLRLQNRETLWGSVTNQEVPGRGKHRRVQTFVAQMCQRGLILCGMHGEKG